MKIVGVTPAGRRAYLEVLVPYLLKARDVLDEHHFWLNTNVKSDIRYIQGLAAQYPDFFKVNTRHGGPQHGTAYAIGAFFRDCVDDDTIYIRVDDDVSYVAPDAFEKLAAHRDAHRAPFLVLGNIVNNAVCAHFHQAQGRIPLGWGKVALECLDDHGWASRRFARRLHELFLDDLEAGRHDEWKKTDFSGWEGRARFSINAISWWGHDMRGLEELYDGTYFEEWYLTEVMPERLGRPTEICSDALFGHYAFYTQRRYLECFPTLLARYKAIGEDHSPPRRGRLGRVWDEARAALDLKRHPRPPGDEPRKAREAIARQQTEALSAAARRAAEHD